VERRRFRALWREAHNRNHNGIRTSVRLALLEMRHEVVERIEWASAIARG
jgi:predicted PP-loop superfamily ATPase